MKNITVEAAINVTFCKSHRTGRPLQMLQILQILLIAASRSLQTSLENCNNDCVYSNTVVYATYTVSGTCIDVSSIVKAFDLTENATDTAYTAPTINLSLIVGKVSIMGKPY